MDTKMALRVGMAALLPLWLSACAGGSAVNQPEVLIQVPTLTSLDTSAANVQKSTNAVNSFTTGSGSVEQYMVTRQKTSYGFSYESTDPVFVYKTSDGKFYEFSNLNTAITPEYSSPEKLLSSVQPMQATDNGGKIFACCTGEDASSPAAVAVQKSYYGAWVSKDGEATFFSGGEAADVNYMQGGKERPSKGKATYEVLGVRVKDGSIAYSSYAPKNWSKQDAATQVSQLTVNFNTGKLGGEIVGNSRFGDSIVMKDVSVSGNTFSGSATSGSATGSVSGGFYGDYSNWGGDDWMHSGKEIGGVVKFGDKSLDAAFGGTRTVIDVNSTSTDLTPLSE